MDGSGSLLFHIRTIPATPSRYASDVALACEDEVTLVIGDHPERVLRTYELTRTFTRPRYGGGGRNDLRLMKGTNGQRTGEKVENATPT